MNTRPLLSLVALLVLACGVAAQGGEPSFQFDLNQARRAAAAQPSPSGAPAAGQPRSWSLSGEQRAGDVFSTLNDAARSPWSGWRRLWPQLSDYQIGDEWGKKPVTAAALAAGGPIFERAAKATARYGGATAFYLGRFNGRYLVATNHHVSGSSCKGEAEFPLLGRSFSCEKVYGDWPEVDLALFSIRVPRADEPLLAPLGRDFAFDADIYPGQRLLTIGFGVANNAGRQMVANQDGDCVVFSKRNNFRRLADPDEFNPGDYQAWSFANGCDVSHGDSGSAFIDRRTGDVLGIVWTGRFPKSEPVGRSSYLVPLIGSDDPQVWNELTLSVPAAKIRERVREAIAALPAGGDDARTLSAVIGSPAAGSAAR